MSIPGSASPLFFTAAADAAAAGPIKSVRFNSADSAYLNRTNSSAGSLTTWTWAAWIKLSEMNNTYPCLFSAGDANDRFFVRYESGGTWEIFTDPPNGAAIERHSTNAVFRDFSGWAHYCLVWNTSSSTAAERVRFYVNGVEQTLDGTFSQNLQSSVNDSTEQLIGKEAGYSRYLDGYLADVYFIDGQALDPTSFGAFDDNGVWQAAAYSGTFGTNGFHLFDFANESGIGDDSSGNDNDFTVNNLSTGVYSGTKPKWYTSTTLYTTKADVIANATDRGQDAFTLSSDEFVYLVPNDGGVVGELCHPEGSEYPSLYYVYVRSSGDTSWYNTGSHGVGEADTFQWENTTGTPQAYDYTNTEDLYLIGDTRTSSQPDANSKMSGSFPALVNLVGQADVLRDVPTNGDSSDDSGAGGEVSGNYATLNPLVVHNTASPVFSNGNLEITDTGQSGYNNAVSTIGVSSGKWYVECTNEVGAYNFIGIQQGSVTGGYIGNDANGWSYAAEGYLRHDSTNTSYGSVTYGAGDVIGIALDLDSATKTLTFYKNGTSLGTAYSGSDLDADVYHFGGTLYTTNDKQVWNFGQRAFAYSAPSGFSPLCTTLLPTPTIADGSTAFDAKTFTANNGTQTVSGFNLSPDLIWTKSRTNAYAHQLWDQVRGANKALMPNETSVEANLSNSLAFTSDGFTSGKNNNANYSSGESIAWAWDAGSSTASNTDGSQTSQVRANQTAGFSIATFNTPNPSAQFTYGHGLNAAPEFVIHKFRDVSSNWYSYHKSIGQKYINLNDTGAAATNEFTTAPTSSVFTYPSSLIIGADEPMVAYSFTSVAGYSAFGSYTAGGASNFPFVYTGFRPAFILYRYSNTAGNWAMFDSKRNTYNVMDNYLLADTNAAEASLDIIDFLSNGFKIRIAQPVGNTVIYACFAENPFQANGGLAR
jgi:hypothetical protein